MSQLSETEVEAYLRTLYLASDDRTSLLEQLRESNGDRTQAEVVKDVLETLADYSENAAVMTALVWRYAPYVRAWSTYRNPAIRSSEAFLANLEQNTLVKINLVLGTSTIAAKRGSLRIIEQR